MSHIVRVPRALAVALSLAVAAPAAAQQQPAPRFAPATPRAVDVRADLQSADSAARYTRQARTQRRTGHALVAVGLAAVAGAYVQYARDGRMGMDGAQAATFGAGAALGVLGIRRWDAARESAATAERWNAPRTAERR